MVLSGSCKSVTIREKKESGEKERPLRKKNTDGLVSLPLRDDAPKEGSILKGGPVERMITRKKRNSEKAKKSPRLRGKCTPGSDRVKWGSIL